jgi:flagellar basal body rod protein FlgC
MNSVSSIALSSMRFASARLERSAQNVANVNTDGYEAQRAVARAQPNGGVSGSTVPTYGPHPSFDSGAGEVLGSNTDIASETVEQLGAAQQFKAAIALLKTDQDMMKSVLDIKA